MQELTHYFVRQYRFVDTGKTRKHSGMLIHHQPAHSDYAQITDDPDIYMNPREGLKDTVDCFISIQSLSSSDNYDWRMML